MVGCGRARDRAASGDIRRGIRLDARTHRAIADDGPTAYVSGLPIREIAERIREAGIPSHVSDSAGTYVCNSLMYSTRRAVEGTDVTAGFIQVPCSRELGEAMEKPWLELEDIAQALVIAVEVSQSVGSR